jgi:hypothetical protein
MRNHLWLVGLFVLLGLAACTAKPDFEVAQLRCDRRINPLGVERQEPVLSWQTEASKRGFLQAAYQIRVADESGALKERMAPIWDSGKVASNESVQVPYQGPSLQSGETYYWQVRVWDADGNASDWSEPAFWQMGLLGQADWKGAKWVAYEEMPRNLRVVPGVHGSGNHLGEKGLHRVVVPMFRKDFDLKGKIKEATLFISGLGQYEASINGQKVDEVFLAPGWTDYDKTVLYNSYDVAELLQAGQNALGVFVGPGFYNINRERYRKMVIAYGYPKMLCLLQIKYEDGSEEAIVSDADWTTAPSPVTYASIYGGEHYDANLEQEGWDTPGFDDSAWNQVVLPQAPSGKLMAEFDYPVRFMDAFSPIRTIPLEDGSYVFDFGQNASGVVEISVSGKKGQTVHIWPAELLNEDGTPNQKATGRPHYYTYVLKGDGVEVWRPRFSYYGLKYAQVLGAVPEGYEKGDSLARLEAVRFYHTRNSSPSNGSFSSSNELFNGTHQIIDWAIRSNYQSVLTDCPHREKLGWMEQTFLMGNGVHFNYDNYHLYRKLIYGMMDGQTKDGLIPTITPEFPLFEGEFLSVFRDSPEWGSAGVLLPYLLYKWYGDLEVIDEAWDMMVDYVRYLESTSSQHIVSHGLSDWYDLGPEKPGFSQLTTQGLTATAIYYYDVKILAEMAAVSGRTSEVAFFESWAEDIRNAFNTTSFDVKTKVYATGSQTSMAMPLVLGIVEEPYRDEVFANFVQSIENNDKALTAGDVGFHYVVVALRTGGRSDLLYDMNNRDDVPGYGYQLKKGVTALTESWMALGSVSNNHLMLGHIMEWFFNGLGGVLQTDASTAYRHLVLKPQVVGDLTHTHVTFKTPYGDLVSNWELNKGESFSYRISVPANANAEVHLPFSVGAASVTVNGQSTDGLEDLVTSMGQMDQRFVYKVLSGDYHFRVDF